MTGGAFVALAVSTLLCSSPLCNRIGAAVVVIVAVRASCHRCTRIKGKDAGEKGTMKSSAARRGRSGKL